MDKKYNCVSILLYLQVKLSQTMFIFNKKALIVTLLLILVNGLVVIFCERLTLSIVNIISTSILFLFFLPYAKRNYTLLLGFIFLVFSSICYLDYESPMLRLWLHLFRIFANIFFIIHIYPKHKTITYHNFGLYIIMVVLILLNIYLIYSINGLVDYYTGTLKYSSIAIYSLGAAHILLATVTFWLNMVTDKIPSYFVVFVTLYILSDIINILGYSFDSNILFTINRTFYIFGLYFLIYYAYTLLNPAQENSKTLNT
ncbi:hypothetical protein FPF71_09770 [Algibacter amylolyticus]|uniref:YhhN-like protein n=1 Tax=Algibacter amylolyticus TaxID=1608400 RepID=A0A5M7B875_9FLAO|nr:hypothetical protein [Algibacter amylolyticus]KAA5824457.1 hypothetical protein F2B50_09770 [Algibacter amylolyticus]MBB5269484.1 hypothetical protein [Algibacter amylolyticus]TSJ75230.1 hypothetical protein FPF71_09770 [Algibacter amylolyticus]